MSFSGDLLNPGTEPRLPVLQSDSLLSEPPGEPMMGIKALRFALLKGCLPVEKGSEVEGQQADSGPSGMVRKLGWGGVTSPSLDEGAGGTYIPHRVHGSCTGPASHPSLTSSCTLSNGRLIGDSDSTKSQAARPAARTLWGPSCPRHPSRRARGLAGTLLLLELEGG